MTGRGARKSYGSALTSELRLPCATHIDGCVLLKGAAEGTGGRLLDRGVSPVGRSFSADGRSEQGGLAQREPPALDVSVI